MSAFEEGEMEHKFAFGYEAIKPVLAALGIDPDNKAFAIQRVVVDLLLGDAEAFGVVVV